jgi:glycosyltransferase involved in cell wall biosynthesis
MFDAETPLSDPAIAFDITPLHNAHRYRGIGTYVRGLAHRLANQTEIAIEFWGWSGGALFDVPSPHRTIALPRVPMPEYRGAWLFAQQAMRWRAATSSVRAVHITDPDALTRLSGRKLLTTVYDLIPLKEGVRRRSVVAGAGYKMYLRALRRADTLFAISQQTASDLLNVLHIPAERILVARPGIDLPESTFRNARRERPYFLFLGGPNPNKNLAVLLQAMTATTDLTEELLVAGHWLPNQVAQLNEQLRALELRERVRHVGFVPSGEIAELMRSATAVVIPSRLEGFGLPVGEGLAAGAVVIHSRLPVLEDTSAGAALTFDFDSAAELEARLRRVSIDAKLRDDLRQRGLQRAKDLTWDATVEITLRAYRSQFNR